MQEETLGCLDLTLNLKTFEVSRLGKSINLSKKEFQLLEYLMRNKNKVLTKDKIIEHVWSYEADILPNTVEVYIGYLRNKIDKPFKNSVPLIKTVRGFGYKIEEKMFKSARIKLTSVYLLIIMCITFSFSSIVYVNVSSFTKTALEIHERRFETRIREFRESRGTPINSPIFKEPESKDILNQVKRNTIILLTLLNTVVLLVSGGVAYWFAGRTLNPIEQMTNKQKQFIADAAHELKTPLTAMKTYLEVNKRNKHLDKEKIHEIIDSTLEDVDSLSYLVRNLLKQSRYQDYTAKDFSIIDIKSVVDSVVQKFEPKAKEKNIEIDAKSLKSTKINADKAGITELATILLDNAVKFNNPGGTITLDIKKEGRFAVLTIKDSGIGISKKDLPHIFDRFYKVDEARSKADQDGYGLGLSIAKEIVKKHKGTISAQSNTNEGTTFTVKLPC